MRNKLLLAIIMMLSVSSTLMAQHILYLKSGDNLKGELVGSRRDTVYFRFMGNRLALPISQVNAVYFDELVAPQKIADPYGDRDAKITGYVTDSYLRAETESPDEGAQVYIVKEGDIKGFDYKLVTMVLVFFAAYLSVAFVGWTILMAFGVGFMEAMSTVISAMGNVGPGLGCFGPAFSWAALPDAAKWVLSSLMLIGRLEIFGFLLVFYLPTWRGSWS